MAFFTQRHEDRWYGRKIGETQTLSIAGSSNRLRLGAGFYRAIPSQHCFMRQGDQNVTATTSSCFVPQNIEIFFQVDSSNDTLGSPPAGAIAGPGLQGQPAGAQSDDRYIAVIRSASSGTLYITRISMVDASTE